MNEAQIKHAVSSYFKALSCQFIALEDDYMTVKLSPEADRRLTNRPYYWNFIERTGAAAETMTFTFTFNLEAWQRLKAQHIQAAGTPLGSSRLELLTFDSPWLQQILQAIKEKGRYVHLYEQPSEFSEDVTNAYTSWLIVNYKIEYSCDMKRSELHSLGISLATGEIVEACHHHIKDKTLTPRLPANMHVRETISLKRAQSELTRYVEQIIRQRDHRWAVAAYERMAVELERIQQYYDELLNTAAEEQRSAIEEQYHHRQAEIRWQYKPKIEVLPINCGIFHLLDDRLGTP